MKTRDKILVAVLLLMAAGLYMIQVFQQKDVGDEVVITIDGKEYATYDLTVNQTIIIDEDSGYNQILIQNGKVSMEEADCPDGYCVEHTKISRENETIVCLPHKLVVEIRGQHTTEADSVQFIDVIAQ